MRASRALVVLTATALTAAFALGGGASGAPLSRTSGHPVELFAVDALTGSNAWAAGDFFANPSDTGDYFAATQHYKGSGWPRVGAPSPASSHKAALFGVDAISATNVWAVGQYNASNGNDFTLIEHWAGGRWRIVKSPNPGRYGNGLSAVSAVSAKNVWAVGYYGPPKTLIARWRGAGWKVVGSRDPATGTGSGDVLYGVSALSRSNAWAVGYSISATSGGPVTLVEHWNGSSWGVQQSVDPSNVDNELLAVKAISPSDVWAVGYSTDGTGDHPLIEHYEGHSWSQVSGAALSGQGALSAVSADGSGGVWAVGSTGGVSTRTLVEHWSGATWTKATTPNPSTRENALLGVTAITPKNVWAVGYFGGASGHRSLIEHWNGSSWSVR